MTSRLSLKAQSSQRGSLSRKPGPNFKYHKFQYDRSLRSQVDTPTLSQIPDEILGLFAFGYKNDPSPMKKIFEDNVNSLTESLKRKNLTQESLVAHLSSLPNTLSYEELHYEAFSKDIELKGLRPRDRELKVCLSVLEQIVKNLDNTLNPETLSVSEIIKGTSLKPTTSENKRNLTALFSLLKIQARSQDKKDKGPLKSFKPLFTLKSDWNEKTESLLGSRGQLKLSKLLKTLHLDLKNSFLKELITKRIRFTKDVPLIFERQAQYKPWKQKAYLSGQTFAIPHPVKSKLSMPQIRLQALLDAHRPLKDEVIFQAKEKNFSLKTLAHIAGRSSELGSSKRKSTFLTLLKNVAQSTFEISCDGNLVTMSPETSLMDRLKIFHGFSPESLDAIKSESEHNSALKQDCENFKSSRAEEDGSIKKSSRAAAIHPQKSSRAAVDRAGSNYYNSGIHPLSLYKKSLQILSVYKRDGGRLNKELLRAFQNLLTFSQKRLFEQICKYFHINIYEQGELTCKSKFAGLMRSYIEAFAESVFSYCGDNGIVFSQNKTQSHETRPVSVIKSSKYSTLNALYTELERDDGSACEKRFVKSIASTHLQETFNPQNEKEESMGKTELSRQEFENTQGSSQREAHSNEKMLENTLGIKEIPEMKDVKKIRDVEAISQKSPLTTGKTLLGEDSQNKSLFEKRLKNELYARMKSYVKEEYVTRIKDFLHPQGHIQLKVLDKNLLDMKTDGLMRGYLKRSLSLTADALRRPKVGSSGRAQIC